MVASGAVKTASNMPLTKKGKEIMAAMVKEYGSKRGKNVFYAAKNKGTIKGVDYSRRSAK